MSETKFQVGDVCEAHGNKGKVIEIEPIELIDDDTAFVRGNVK